MKVTDWPFLEGFLDEVGIVVEEAGFTVSLTGDDVLFALRESPLYVAVSERTPAGRLLTDRVAVPSLPNFIVFKRAARSGTRGFRGRNTC